MTTNNIPEGVAATAATGAGLGISVATADHWLHVAIGVLTLAWWIRLWVKNPNIKPPTAP